MLPLTDFIERFKHVAHPVSGLTLLIDCFFKCHYLLITLFTPLLWLVLLEFLLCYCGLCRTSETLRAVKRCQCLWTTSETSNAVFCRRSLGTAE